MLKLNHIALDKLEVQCNQAQAIPVIFFSCLPVPIELLTGAINKLSLELASKRHPLGCQRSWRPPANLSMEQPANVHVR
jgi:hypothetical protein